MLNFSEKRKQPRIDVRIPLTYKELRATSTVSKGALTKNLSVGGVKFHSDGFISLSCRMILEINLPLISKPLRAISKVAWIRKLPAGEDYEIGNQFLDMKKEDRSMITDFIKKAIIQPAVNPDQT
ncbi:MAG: PilZ domain-containing protein [Candidatus Omnitrophica bacterium]|nr:PilZ domain-containing protein [Candidatus Omnitrophota bacterium]